MAGEARQKGGHAWPLLPPPGCRPATVTGHRNHAWGPPCAPMVAHCLANIFDCMLIPPESV